MANVAEEGGDLEEDENTIIQNLINMDEVIASDAMTPRVVCDIAPETMTAKQFFKDKRYLHHSRIPVYDKDEEYITGYSEVTSLLVQYTNYILGGEMSVKDGLAELNTLADEAIEASK